MTGCKASKARCQASGQDVASPFEVLFCCRCLFCFWMAAILQCVNICIVFVFTYIYIQMYVLVLDTANDIQILNFWDVLGMSRVLFAILFALNGSRVLEPGIHRRCPLFPGKAAPGRNQPRQRLESLFCLGGCDARIKLIIWYHRGLVPFLLLLLLKCKEI